VTPEEGYQRISRAKDEKRQDSDKFRELDFITNLRKYFLDLPNNLPNENIQIINSNVSIPQVFAQITPLLDKVLH